MAYQAPTTCPVCKATMQVTALQCPHCDSTLTGRFAPCRFCALEPKDLQFIEVFLQCRGSIKDVERTLGVSYPTVRGMLDNALRALGFESPAQDTGADDARRAILDLLESGEIDAKEAVKRLKDAGRS